jgi:hypothetical protein
MEWIINILGFSAIGSLWILSEPTIRLREWLTGDRFNWFTRLINCGMCSSFHIYFWWQLLVNFNIDILGAAMVSILSEIIIRKLESGNI